MQAVVRRFSVSSAAGVIAGLLWIGVGARYAMHLIAINNEHATSLTSDDGFVIGRFTTSGSLNLLVVGVGIGVLGGCLYVALRGLRIGPAWFKLLSITLGPAVVALSMVVHPDGIDFTVLRPPALTVGAFAVVAWGYTLTVVLLAEWFLKPGGLAERAPSWLVVLMALPSVLVFPLVLVLAVGRLVLPLLEPVAVPAAWVARAGLFAAFVASVVSLSGTIAEIA